MKILECKQYSPEWWEAHRGRPTASNFDKIITAKYGKLSAQCDDLICELIAQIATDGPIIPPTFVSAAMQHGTDTEPEARRYYKMLHNCEVREVGMCITDDDRFGASPDGLIDNEGGLELKCPQLKTQVKYLLEGSLPDEYKAQVHGCLIITGRPWWDFMSYAIGLDPLIVRVFPDDYTAKLSEALEAFWIKYEEAKAKILHPQEK